MSLNRHPIVSLLSRNLVGAAEWAFGYAFLMFGVRLPGLWADSGFSMTDWNTRIMLISLGVVAVGSKVVEVFLTGWARFRAIDKESDHGQLVKCKEDFEAFRAKVKADIMAERTIVAAEMDRIKAYHAAASKDYEDRLENKRTEIDFLYIQTAAMRDADRKKMETINELTATIVQQNEVMSRLAQQSAVNVSDAIRKIPRVPGRQSDPDMATITTPVDRVEVVTPVHPAEGHESGEPVK